MSKGGSKGSVRVPRVMVVDDDPMVRLLAKSALESLGVEVEIAAHGAAALAIFKNAEIDLILLDVVMPNVDGFRALSMIRDEPRGEHVTIVMLTGTTDLVSIERAYALGAADFITKPINWAILKHRIRYLLRARDTLNELIHSRRRLSDAQRIAHIGHWEWVMRTGESEFSAELENILGRSPSASDGAYAYFLDSVHPGDRARLSTVVTSALERRGTFQIEHRAVLPGGEERILYTQGHVLLDGAGVPERLRCVVQDITERKVAEARIHHLSNYDELTGLPNREFFIEFAERVLEAAQQDGTAAAIVLMDIDRFKRINESLGHAAGDELLRTIASRISDAVRRSDIVAKTGMRGEMPAYSLARPGADEFMILLRGSIDAVEVANLVQRITEDLGAPVGTARGEIYLSASIGIALYPGDGADVDALLRSADSALAHAKGEGGNGLRFFAPEMNQRATARLGLESRLNRALANEEMRLYYQPLVSFATGKLVGYEALLRWMPDGDKPVSPGEFVPIAEESGLIVSIGEWVIRTACAQLAAWREQGYELVPVAVNLSGRQFTRPELVDIVRSALNEAAIAPHYLELELTEGILMNDLPDTGNMLRGLKDLGLKLSVDDFGTGYSSLAYLKRFPLDTLKIDRTFVMDIVDDPRDEAIVSSIVALCSGLDLRTVAEGVETAHQHHLLQRLGCDIAQGYLIGRPQPADDVASLMALARADAN